jgi:AcrR family transcriptional regulator
MTTLVRHRADSSGESSKACTIKRLLTAARFEFAHKGYAETRIDDIARAAGVTKQLVYHYYRDKEELFSCVLEDVSTEVMHDLLERLERDCESAPPEVAFRALIDMMIDHYCRDPMLGRLAGEGIRYHNWHGTQSEYRRRAPALLVKVEKMLQRGIATGAFRRDIDVRALLGMVVLTTSGAFTNRYSLSVILGIDSTSPQGIAEWRRSVADLLVGAIAARQPSEGPIEAFAPTVEASRAGR